GVVSRISVWIEALELPAPDAGVTSSLPEVSGWIHVTCPVFASRSFGHGVFTRVEAAVATRVAPQPPTARGLPGRPPIGFLGRWWAGAEAAARPREVTTHREKPETPLPHAALT